MRPNFTTLKIEEQEAIAYLTLNRPKRLNALSGTCLRELADADEITSYYSTEISSTNNQQGAPGAGCQSGFTKLLSTVTRTNRAF